MIIKKKGGFDNRKIISVFICFKRMKKRFFKKRISLIISIHAT